jgi:hypothetical protein
MMAAIIINHPNAKGIIYLLPTSTPWTYAEIVPFLVGKTSHQNWGCHHASSESSHIFAVSTSIGKQ